MENFWTEERVQQLIVCVNDKMSARETAIILHGNRNQMIGKAKRLGYRFHSAGDVLERRAKPKSNGRQVPVNIRNTRDRSRGPDPQAPDPVPEPTIDDLSIPMAQRKTLLDLTNHTCRWPVGDSKDPDFFFCGAEPLPEKPYCAAHNARAFAPVYRSTGGQFRLPR